MQEAGHYLVFVNGRCVTEHTAIKKALTIATCAIAGDREIGEGCDTQC